MKRRIAFALILLLAAFVAAEVFAWFLHSRSTLEVAARSEPTQSACLPCDVVRYHEIENNPFYAHVMVMYSGGNVGAATYHVYFVHVCGTWFRVLRRLTAVA